MKRIQLLLCAFVAMFMLSVNSAWAGSAYVKVTAEDGTVSWIKIYGTINGKNIKIYKGESNSAIDKNTKGAINLKEVWSLTGGSGSHYQVTSIGDYAFYYCRSLTSISIPSSVTSIGNSAFYNCSGLTSVAIPSSVTSIERLAFSDCTGLTSVVILSNVTSIGDGAFSCCSGLTTIFVESGNAVYDSRNNCNAIIETATNTLIAGCKNTKIPSGVTSIGDGAFSCCSGLTSIEIPSSVTSIGRNAFDSCFELTSVIIPSSVTSIGDGAFFWCSGLTSITIPSSVTSIEQYAFGACTGLTSITSYITEVFETGSDAFCDCDNATLYVPKGLKSIYWSISDWNRFKKIEEMPEVIPVVASLAMSCNNKGKVKINGVTEFTNNMGEVEVNNGVENTFIFQPNNNCELRQVLIDGLDVTLSVENNQLTTKVHEGSKMIVMFDKTSNDVNGDGQVDISDVVRLVNFILGQ